jgi:hypothetical protein
MGVRIENSIAEHFLSFGSFKQHPGVVVHSTTMNTINGIERLKKMNITGELQG